MYHTTEDLILCPSTEELLFAVGESSTATDEPDGTLISNNVRTECGVESKFQGKRYNELDIKEMSSDHHVGCEVRQFLAGLSESLGEQHYEFEEEAQQLGSNKEMKASELDFETVDISFLRCVDDDGRSSQSSNGEMPELVSSPTVSALSVAEGMTNVQLSGAQVKNMQHKNVDIWGKNMRPNIDDIWIKNMRPKMDDIYVKNMRPKMDDIQVENIQHKMDDARPKSMQPMMDDTQVKNMRPNMDGILVKNIQPKMDDIRVENMQLKMDDTWVKNMRPKKDDIRGKIMRPKMDDIRGKYMRYKMDGARPKSMQFKVDGARPKNMQPMMDDTQVKSMRPKMDGTQVKSIQLKMDDTRGKDMRSKMDDIRVRNTRPQMNDIQVKCMGPMDAARVVKSMRPKMDDIQVRPKMDDILSKRDDGVCRIYFGSIPYTATCNELRRCIFNKTGFMPSGIEMTKRNKSNSTNHRVTNGGIAFVQMSTFEQAKVVIDAFDNKMNMGRKMYAHFDQRDERSFNMPKPRCHRMKNHRSDSKRHMSGGGNEIVRRTTVSRKHSDVCGRFKRF